MVAEITLAGTAASPSVSTATLVIHGFGPWGNARGASPLAEGQRGFTGHEHLAELGIIHMNGRLYDAVIGRFLQADPIIQAPHNAQSHNRYSYVLNNPLSFTDPSGFSAWTKWRAPIIGIIVSILTYGAASYAMSAYALANSTATIFASASGTLNGVGMATAAAAAAGFASGGINGGNIQSALRGAFFGALTAGLFDGISEAFANASGGNGALCVVECGPGVQHLTAGGGSVTQAINSAAPPALQIPVTDALPLVRLDETVVITAPKYNDWVRNGLDWLANGPSDRSTIGGAVWMGMMAASGGRLGGVGRGASTLSKAEQLVVNQKAGAVGEQFLKKAYGGEQQVTKPTSLRARRLDNLADGIAQES